MPIKVRTEREMSWRGIYARGHADTCVIGFAAEYRDSRWSGGSGGCGRRATIWDQVDDVSATGNAIELFENLYASGKAERGTRVAQTLSKRNSSHIWRTRSMSNTWERARRCQGRVLDGNVRRSMPTHFYMSTSGHNQYFFITTCRLSHIVSATLDYNFSAGSAVSDGLDGCGAATPSSFLFCRR